MLLIAVAPWLMHHAECPVPNDTAGVSLRTATPSFEGERGEGLTPAGYEPPHGLDVNFVKSRTNPAVKPYTFGQDQTWVGLPVFAAGLIAKSEKRAFQQDYNNPNTKIRLIKYDFHSEIDNYTQYVPLALTIGLKMGSYEGRSDWPRFWASAASAAAIMAGIVNGVKYTAREMRPDGSTRNSWPSGHTATAFMAATILHKEYGLTRSPWFSAGAYGLATATGVMRVLNNRHWISDVLSGAGIGILSTELGYGLMDILFKNRGLMRGDLEYRPDLRNNPSFFSISMGLGFGNKRLDIPAFGFIGFGPEHDGKPMQLKFGNATAVGTEAAWFFNRHIGVGGRLRVKATPIKGWSALVDDEEAIANKMLEIDELRAGIRYFGMEIESDHITEFAADGGLYLNLPLSSRFALGTKLLAGCSVMDDVDVTATFLGDKMSLVNGHYVATDEVAYQEWHYLTLGASNSLKLGSGISLTYAHKNAFSWRLFLDYDYATKVFTATYAPLAYGKEFCPQAFERFQDDDADPTSTFTSSTRKHLHQWVLGGALCVSF